MAALLIGALFSVPGTAEIYQCTGSNGRPVFTEEPCPDDQITGNAAQHRVWRAMRQLAVEGKSLSANLAGTVESIQQCRDNVKAFRDKLDALLPDMAHIQHRHPHLHRAFDFLRECAECRFAAPSYCDKADQELDRAMKRLR